MTILALLLAVLPVFAAKNQAPSAPKPALSGLKAPASSAGPAIRMDDGPKAGIQGVSGITHGIDQIVAAGAPEADANTGAAAGMRVYDHSLGESKGETAVCAGCAGSEAVAAAPALTVGVVREIKANEQRVGLTPAGVASLRGAGIDVVVERGAGEKSGYTDAQYAAAGARLVGTPQEVFAQAGLIKHVKELQPSEYALLRPDHLVFTYNHFEEDAELTKRSVDSKATFISYEKVVVAGKTPLLAPMSRIAGELAAQWTKPEGRKVVVLGGGVAGEAAAREALKLGAKRVVITEFSAARRKQLKKELPDAFVVDSEARDLVFGALWTSDVIVGTVYVKGRAPVIIGHQGQQDDGKAVPFTLEEITAGGKTKDIVDISVDQGGNVAWVTDKDAKTVSHAKTSHTQKFAVDAYGNRLFRVPNMPAAMPQRASVDLEAATLPYLLSLARGLGSALRERPELAGSVSISDGLVLDPKVAQAHGVAAPVVSAAPAQPETAASPRAWAAFLAVAATALIAAALIVLFR